MFNTFLAANITQPQPDNNITIDAGFWNYVPLIVIGILIIIWTIIVKAIEKKKNSKKDDEESK